MTTAAPAELTVRHVADDRFAVDVRGHTIAVDQPTEAGGADTAPTPTELFVASLASCIAFYARRYLARHRLPAAGLAVTAGFTLGSSPARVADANIVITPPESLPADRRDAFLAVASHCTVHNSLVQPPHVDIALAREPVTR